MSHPPPLGWSGGEEEEARRAERGVEEKRVGRGGLSRREQGGENKRKRVSLFSHADYLREPHVKIGSFLHAVLLRSVCENGGGRFLQMRAFMVCLQPIGMLVLENICVVV